MWCAGVLLTLCLVTACSSIASAAEPEPIPGLQNFESAELDNGLRLLAGEPSRSMSLAEVLLVVRAGTGTAPVGQEDLPWIAAEALIAGHRSSTSPTVRTELLRLGVSPEFTVGREVAVFRFAVPARNTLAFLHVLADLLGREVDQATWAEAIARRGEEVRRERADPWQRASAQLSNLIWIDPSARESGRAAVSARDFDRAALVDFWSRAYTPVNMVLSIWGELPTAELVGSVRGEFARLPAAAVAPLPLAPEPVYARNGRIGCLKDGNANPAALLVGVGAELTDDADFYAWQLVAHILGASYNSRLQHRLRTESQVVYTVEASGIPVGAHGFILRVATQTDQLETTRQIILEELRRLAREPVTPAELEFAKALVSSRLRLDAASYRDRFYRLSLVLLSHEHVRDPLAAEPLIVAFTPARLFEFINHRLKPDESASVIISRQSEPLCEAGHDVGP